MPAGPQTTPPTAADEVFVGVDWGGSHHQLCAVSHTGQRLRQVRLGHDVAGLQQLDTELARLGRCLPVSLERPKGCWSSICRLVVTACSR